MAQRLWLVHRLGGVKPPRGRKFPCFQDWEDLRYSSLWGAEVVSRTEGDAPCCAHIEPSAAVSGGRFVSPDIEPQSPRVLNLRFSD